MNNLCIDCGRPPVDANNVRCQQDQVKFEVRRTFILNRRIEKLYEEEFNGGKDLPLVRSADSE